MCFAHSTWCHPLYQSCEVGRFSFVIYMFGNGDTSQSDRVFSLLLKVLWQKLKPHGGGWGSSTGSAKVLKMKPSQKMQNLWINSVEKNWRSGQNQFEINPWKAYSYITNYPPMLTFPPMSLTWPWWPSNRIQYPIINFSMQKMLLLD